MGRKNNRIVSSPDANFQKFMDSINKANKTKVDSKPKYSKHNDIDKNTHARSDPKKHGKTFATEEERIMERTKYAEQQFRNNHIPYNTLNEKRGVIKVWHRNTKTEYIYYANSGVLKGVENVRGIKTVLIYLNSREEEI